MPYGSPSLSSPVVVVTDWQKQAQAAAGAQGFEGVVLGEALSPEGNGCRKLSLRDITAGEGIRTLNSQLGRLTLYQLSYARDRSVIAAGAARGRADAKIAFEDPGNPPEWEREDLNLRRRLPADLQSAPFDHSGTLPQRQGD